MSLLALALAISAAQGAGLADDTAVLPCLRRPDVGDEALCRRTGLGLISPSDPATRRLFPAKVPEGLLVILVDPEVYYGQMEQGDILTMINGRPVATIEDVEKCLSDPRRRDKSTAAAVFYSPKSGESRMRMIRVRD